MLALAAGLAAVSCIERSNPFDPINSGDARILSVREQLQPGLKARADGEDAYGRKLEKYDSAFRSDSSDNATVMGRNEKRKSANTNLEDSNATVAAFNAQAPVDSLKLKQTYAYLDTLQAYAYVELDGSQRDLRAQTVSLALYMSQANATYNPATIYPPAFSDSVLEPFVRDSTSFTALRARIDSGNLQVIRYNADLLAYNSIQADSNHRIDKYNDSIAFLKSTGNNPVYTRADSLDAGTKGAKAGEVLLIGQGAYTVDLRFNNSGTQGNPIQVRGYPGGLTVLRAPAGGNSAMTLSAKEHIQFQDIDFRGGVQIVAKSSGIIFRRCVFDSGAISGLSVVNSGVDLVDCRLVGNGIGVSILGDAVEATQVNMTNVLIAANTKDGVALVDAKGIFTRCTIAHNGGDGLNLKIGWPGLQILSSIISGNGGLGIYRHRNTELQDQPVVQQCDVWRNGGGDWSLAGLDSGAIEEMKRYDRSIEPAFIDPARLDYRLQPGSALAELENQAVPVVIGYRP